MQTSRIRIMGILNVTDDSFYSKSRAVTEDAMISLIDRHIKEGADIIDIGGCSTRPGSVPADARTEWERIRPALRIMVTRYPGIPFSVDTFRSGIVRRCYDEFGPFTVNDISAGEDDPRMLRTVASLGLGYIAMHKRGTPSTMQGMCEYGDVVADIVGYFRRFAVKAGDMGIEDWILDPGFGFAKTISQNYEMLDRLAEFKVLGRKILVGISRKSFIYRALGITPEEALDATTELHRKAVANGADILRVHDVAAAAALR
ncbi:MAG TPA: dihydropteroate synthase [Candidatus Coprenecus stercoripullorum]|nr:dihydropteroate synthase [Candidatus Coprenecus stercoripullorum]